MSNLLSSCEFTENVLRYGNEAEIMLVKPPIVSRLQNLNNHESQCEPEDNQVRTRSRGKVCQRSVKANYAIELLWDSVKIWHDKRVDKSKITIVRRVQR